MNLSSWYLLLTIVVAGELLRTADSEKQFEIFRIGRRANWRLLKGPLHHLGTHRNSDRTRAPSDHCWVIFRCESPRLRSLVITDGCLVESFEERHVGVGIPTKCVKDIDPTEWKIQNIIFSSRLSWPPVSTKTTERCPGRVDEVAHTALTLTFTASIIIPRILKQNDNK